MKQFFFLLLVLLVSIGAKGATVSGTVTNATTYLPVSGQKVYVRDSFYTFLDSAVTSSSGSYSITLPAASSLPNSGIYVYTYACGKSYVNTYSYLGSSITSNFNVCATTTPFVLHGNITLNGAANNGPVRLYVILKQYDSLLMDTTLAALDSFSTSSGSYSKSYSSIPGGGGTLLLKAALQAGHFGYSSYVPTYYTSSLVWSGATALSSANFNSSNSTNIPMIAGSNAGGPGFVGGSVILGANKTSAVGDPLPGRILILTNSTGQGIAYTYSDAAGAFSFSNLAVGTYKIFGDAWGKTNPALTFTLTNAKPGITNIVFEENSNSFKGTLNTLSVSSTITSDISVYPNPVADRLVVTGLDNISGSKTALLSDVTGAVMQTLVFVQGQPAMINTANLPNGMYLLRLQTDAGSINFRVVK
jgi:hypothetical protein